MHKYVPVVAAGEVYMYEAPPPYSGIGPNMPAAPYPAGQTTEAQAAPSAPAPPSYDEATKKKQ